MSTIPLAFDQVVVGGDDLPGARTAWRHAGALADWLGVGVTSLTSGQDADGQREVGTARGRPAGNGHAADTKGSSWSSPILVVRDEGGPQLLSEGTTRRLIGTTVHPILVVGPNVPSDPPPAPFDRVGVCVDGSQASRAILPVAAGLARTLGSSVLFVHVIYPLVEASTGDASLSTDDEAMYDLLADLAAEWQGAGLVADWQVVQSEDPPRGVLSVVRRGDLLAAATHGRSRLGRLLFGSTVDPLVSRSPVPVVTIAPFG